MKAVVLVAGKGTRMEPLTSDCPKVMLKVANKPILEHILNSAIEAGIDGFVFITGYLEEQIKEYFGDGSKWGVSIEYVRQKEQLGTANAIGCAKGYVDGAFLVLNGDMLIGQEDLRALVSRTEEAVICVKEVENPSDFGVLETENDRVVRVIEKPKTPPTNLANAGIYLFRESIFDFIDRTQPSVRNEFEITDSLQMLIDTGATVGYSSLSGRWIDIGYPWDLLKANEHLLKDLRKRYEGTVEPNATIKGEVVIGKGTLIRSGSYIEGPVIIGENCDIGPNCYIRPYTSIGNHVRVGNAVEIKNTIIMENTNVGHLSYVGDSIIGRRCNFGAGTKVANLRHDGKNIKVMIKGRILDSGRRKLGVIMGDDVHTGINTSINTGVVMEKGRFTYPGEIVKH
ncbi:MAG: bifunctional sugar-1-phosphate nucleotidylyltransferase/acetyltransferase [Methanosarcina thermophila]|jgi:UDP-N-acetylglucosamine diphosphorylase/glucosamine-1-phosphate N-acetyltransferase|uniref:Bifunctional protein GlmU n=3 Tax=Methanosarcina thermophila TaxID=2210 RepID=A0A1I7A3T5_METTE|nr:bifunctional sugar-1-phosphate nucleotidylyltransferase/acetyltransferase [Methanosarcina thermophila]ALK05480.1 MAG: glucose-1-phosphate thymidylyltransferase [Methanosarcina sp. 795]AKB14300.1 N-acetylglucosamine-1-phosphate uridyltransferase [Methanosarcina thermophila TM-1]AKB15059.1 N-acetylglucosamine-1-phosphate uridyltransferase [Methanosarcina thermophila CHTI-55]NLU58286.1 NTP transferase domain-containing protein [Methanosarcina thermophila]SFT69580.1 bifunctional UDP-N-acetylglu